jgi:hypothetical protein
VLLQAFEITLNGVADICHRFITRLSLRNATRQRRTFGNEHTVLVGFDCDSKFHPGSLAVGNCFAMEDRAAIPHRKRLMMRSGVQTEDSGQKTEVRGAGLCRGPFRLSETAPSALMSRRGFGSHHRRRTRGNARGPPRRVNCSGVRLRCHGRPLPPALTDILPVAKLALFEATLSTH